MAIKTGDLDNEYGAISISSVGIGNATQIVLEQFGRDNDFNEIIISPEVAMKLGYILQHLGARHELRGMNI